MRTGSLLDLTGLLVVACQVAGCYATAGPTVGLTFEGRPTVGWEVGGAMIAAGQSYELGGARTQGVDGGRGTRSYFVLEPRIGSGQYVHDAHGADQSNALIFVGLGATLGVRMDSADGRNSFGVVGGIWGGGAYAFPTSSSHCVHEWQPLMSIALGLRGEEVYVTPKAGAFQETCL